MDNIKEVYSLKSILEEMESKVGQKEVADKDHFNAHLIYKILKLLLGTVP